jgi:hypothetical protein
MKREFLEKLEYKLHVKEEEYTQWLWTITMETASVVYGNQSPPATVPVINRSARFESRLPSPPPSSVPVSSGYTVPSSSAPLWPSISTTTQQLVSRKDYSVSSFVTPDAYRSGKPLPALPTTPSLPPVLVPQDSSYDTVPLVQPYFTSATKRFNGYNYSYPQNYPSYPAY